MKSFNIKFFVFNVRDIYTQLEGVKINNDFVEGEKLKCDSCKKIKYNLNEKIFVFEDKHHGICEDCKIKFEKTTGISFK